MTDEQFTKLAVSELQKIGLLDKNIDIELSHVEHVKKAYPAYFDTYDHIKNIQNWVDKQDGLMCIGRNGQHQRGVLCAEAIYAVPVGRYVQ